MKTTRFSLVLACLMAISAVAAAAEDDPLKKGLAAYEAEDYATALAVWRPLAEAGNTEAQFYIGYMTEQGQGLPADPEIAVNWYR
ncbi:MAG: sel1 repeat family protein, partial [Acidobacteriota bacterium]